MCSILNVLRIIVSVINNLLHVVFPVIIIQIEKERCY
jgi:hypothetical protein